MINKLYDFQAIHKAGTSAINYGKVQNDDDGYFANDTSIKKFKWKKSLNGKKFKYKNGTATVSSSDFRGQRDDATFHI
jgi:hypothetical protein